MIELRFHRDLYAGPSVDEAVKAFTGFAQMALTEEPSHWVVRLTAEEEEREVAGELSNYALGLTIKNRGVR